MYTRAVLADDALNLAQYGHLDFSIPFNIVNCWRYNEYDYLPWKAVLDNLEFIFYNSFGIEHFEALYVRFKYYTVSDLILNCAILLDISCWRYRFGLRKNCYIADKQRRDQVEANIVKMGLWNNGHSGVH